jgi:hypothetical protein
MLRRRMEAVVRDAKAELEAQAAAAETERQTKRRWWKPWQR